MALNEDWWKEVEPEVRKDVKLLFLYLQKNAKISTDLQYAVQNLTELDNRDLGYLCAVHFLLSNQVALLTENLSRLLRRINHSTVKKMITSRKGIMGRIDWNMTFKERLTQGNNPTVFVCNPPSKIYDLPENRLFRFVLAEIIRLFEETAVLRKLEGRNIEEKHVETWIDAVDRVKFNVTNAAKHAHLRGVELPGEVTVRMLKRAEEARNKDYETLVRCHELYKQIVVKRELKKLREVIEKKVLEPLSPDVLYELFVLFKIMQTLGGEKGVGKLKELNLIKPSSVNVAIYSVGNELVKLYYQHVPFESEKSRYKQIFEEYPSLNVSARRPDIVLEWVKEEKFLIIEVKRTKNKNYIVDSAYKVLGYLKDFWEYFPEKQKPQGALVVWDYGERCEGRAKHDVTIIAHDEIEDFFRKHFIKQR